jgi:hypothetical protein
MTSQQENGMSDYIELCATLRRPAWRFPADQKLMNEAADAIVDLITECAKSQRLLDNLALIASWDHHALSTPPMETTP